MEQNEITQIEKYAANDAELRVLWEEHLLYEQQLEKLEKKPYRAPSDERAIKDIKKKKLTGKTKIQKILDRYAGEE